MVRTLDAARDERSHEGPIIADDGRTLIFSVNAIGADVDEETVSILTLATNARHTVRTGGPAYVLTDREELLYVRMGSLMGARYVDGQRESPTLLEPSSASDRVASSSSGTLAFVPEPDYKRRSLVWISPDGRMTDAGFGQRAFAAVALSLDGRRTVIRIVDDRDDALYTADPGGGALAGYPIPTARVQVSREGGSWPLWSKHGDALCFRAGPALLTSAMTTHPELCRGVPRVIVSDPLLAKLIAGAKPYDIAPDGRILAIREDGSTRADHVVVVHDWLSEARARLRSMRQAPRRPGVVEDDPPSRPLYSSAWVGTRASRISPMMRPCGGP